MATAVYLPSLGLPLLLEGEPGVGKTAAAQVLAEVLDAPLVRLQCYEGLSASEALYEWNHQRQLLAIRVAESQHQRIVEADLFSEEFLRRAAHPAVRPVRRPASRRCCSSTRSTGPTTSSRPCCSRPRRGVGDRAGAGHVPRPQPRRGAHLQPEPRAPRRARRRCLYHWLDYPEHERVVAILRLTAPSASAPLIESAAQFVGHVRSLDVDKPPGVAEAINWVAALSALGATELVREVVVKTLGALAKTPDDRDLVVESLDTHALG